ncbi:conserved hypothetical protein [Rhodoferax ferrireducens T118]|uniref:Uncharacterized protein n=1 Tax=Albidiferax ferrireducens (strain ATCC BAA-621 / DSM 15236 / T118) TaxID=338969 RepID=Q21Y19_ALBFT|nr:conserved hypothetical protein [Rhodoferax ferrireducens T118]
MRSLFQFACSGKIVKNSLRIAVVVGSILNLVNQGSAILAGTGISWVHVSLNYLVPYCVASYSAARNEMTPRGNQ